MASLAKQINIMVEQLQEPEQILVLEIVKRFLPDDVASLDDLDDISIARAQYQRGETVKHDAIDWD